MTADNVRLRPDWQPENAGNEFACSVMPGIIIKDDCKIVTEVKSSITAHAPRLTAKDYTEGIINGDRVKLSRAITIIESNSPKHFELGQKIIQDLLPYTGNAIRVGITGFPGAGKSTFIESLGTYLCRKGSKVAAWQLTPAAQSRKEVSSGTKQEWRTFREIKMHLSDHLLPADHLAV